jgi:anti-anti-sigma factor
MVLKKELGHGEVEIEVRGNLTGSLVGEFREVLNEEVGSPHTLIRLDLDKVRVINSFAIGSLLFFRKRAQESGKAVRLVRCSQELRQTLLAIRFDKVMDMPEEEKPGNAGVGR